MYSASVAAQNYGGMFVSGFGFAASYYGLPDIGFIAWPDMVSFVQRCGLPSPDSTYWWISTTVMSTRGGLPCGGASGAHRRLSVILEDQKRPRRCGHVTVSKSAY